LYQSKRYGQLRRNSSQKLTKILRMVEDKVAPRKVEGKMPKRTRRNGERKSLEPFPDAQLAMQIPTDEDDERN
jgi:hypothetical protein